MVAKYPITSLNEALKVDKIREDLKKKLQDRLIIGEVPPNKLCGIDTPCYHLHNAYITPGGYVNVNFSNVALGYSIKVQAHILIFFLYSDILNLDKQINHVCNVFHCVNINHLVLGSPKPNGDHAVATRDQERPDLDSWKTSVDQRREIRIAHAFDGISIAELAEQHDLSTSTIYRILDKPEPKKQEVANETTET